MFIFNFVLGGPRSEAKLWKSDNRSPTLIKHIFKEFYHSTFKINSGLCVNVFFFFLLVCPKVSGAHSIVQEFE